MQVLAGLTFELIVSWSESSKFVLNIINTLPHGFSFLSIFLLYRLSVNSSSTMGVVSDISWLPGLSFLFIAHGLFDVGVAIRIEILIRHIILLIETIMERRFDVYFLHVALGSIPLHVIRSNSWHSNVSSGGVEGAEVFAVGAIAKQLH